MLPRCTEQLALKIKSILDYPNKLTLQHVDIMMSVLILAQEDDMLSYFDCILEEENFLWAIRQNSNEMQRLRLLYEVLCVIQRTISLKKAIWKSELSSTGRSVQYDCNHLEDPSSRCLTLSLAQMQN